jgi:hypothetical protein
MLFEITNSTNVRCHVLYPELGLPPRWLNLECLRKWGSQSQTLTLLIVPARRPAARSFRYHPASLRSSCGLGWFGERKL